MDRRNFIKWGTFMTVSVASATMLTACGGDDKNALPSNANPGGGGGNGSGNTGGSTPSFSLGVASGDPKPDSIVLWTRVEGGDGSNTIDVRVQVSTSPDFKSLVVDTTVKADPAWDYTLRHKVTGLAANTVYYYRFGAGAAGSMVGRTWTTPAAGTPVAKLKFAFMSSQDWNTNHWVAFDAMQDEDLDFIVHLGDYVYEQLDRPTLITPSSEPQHAPFALPDGTRLDDGSTYATTLGDYRTLYKTYRSDPRLQLLHASWPMIAIWNDHEFSNDAWQDHQTYTNDDSVPQTARRRSANQAWFEFMPADVAFTADNPSFQNIQIYRSFTFGDLATLVMTDERLYRADHAITEKTAGGFIGSRYLVAKDALNAAEATKMTAAGNALTPVSMLGDTQRQWWQDQMSNAKTTWKLWGNEVSLLRMQVDLFDAVLGTVTQAVISTSPLLPPLEATFRGILKIDLTEAITGNLHPAPFTHLNEFGTGLGFPEDDTLTVIAALNQMLPPYSMMTTLLLDADQWDGYNAERSSLMKFLSTNGTHNVVSLTGDINAFFAGTVMDDFDTTKQPVMVDLVTAGISATSLFRNYVEFLNDTADSMAWLGTLAANGGLSDLDATLKSNNPWLTYVDSDAQGYAVVTLTPDQLSCTFKKLTPIDGDKVPTAANVVASTQLVTVAVNTTTVTVATA